jgi:hypothetical protein
LTFLKRVERRESVPCSGDWPGNNLALDYLGFHDVSGQVPSTLFEDQPRVRATCDRLLANCSVKSDLDDASQFMGAECNRRAKARDASELL